jgi:hypothetical protein
MHGSKGPDKNQAQQPAKHLKDRNDYAKINPVKNLIQDIHKIKEFKAKKLGKATLSPLYSVFIASRKGREWLQTCQGDETQGMGGTFGHTGRFQPSINPVNTIVAFDHLVFFWIELWDAPRASARTGHAADAFFLIQHDNAIFPF